LRNSRGGFYLADAVECPVTAQGELQTRVEDVVPTVLKRIEFSYRSKHVVPIGASVRQLIPVLQKSNLADRIVLVDVSAQMGLRPEFGDHIAAALSCLA
jgi:hypothetical protein